MMGIDGDEQFESRVWKLWGCIFDELPLSGGVRAILNILMRYGMKKIRVRGEVSLGGTRFFIVDIDMIVNMIWHY